MTRTEELVAERHRISMDRVHAEIANDREAVRECDRRAAAIQRELDKVAPMRRGWNGHNARRLAMLEGSGR